MNQKPFNVAIDDLKRTGARYESMRVHFERVCAQAKLLAEGPESPLRGFLRAEMDQGALLLAINDRRLRISLQYDRKTERGVLYVEDESAVGPGRVPETIERIPFNGLGETGLAREDGDQLHLGLAADCLTLVARLVDTALDRDPWK